MVDGNQARAVAPRYIRTSGGNMRRASKPTAQQTSRMRTVIYERDGFTCQMCGVTASADQVAAFYSKGWNPSFLNLDHVIPYKIGGEFTEANLQTLCVPCNARKGDRVGDDRAAQ